MRTTLGKHGDTMAIGTEVPAGPRPTGFAFRRWTTADELAIGKERADDPAMNPAGLVDRVLSRMLTSWGTRDFSGAPDG